MEQNNNETKQFEFKAEVKQLLNILVHSLYTNREIFIRELISNASDALDKLRFESNKGTEIEQNDLALEIKLELDDKNNTLTITDTGIGMTEEEIVSNIGTIAKSGSAEFLQQLKEHQNEVNNIIGKFGVGFYSVFMVADKVELITKSYKKDQPAYKWISDGLGSYEITELKEKTNRGTSIKVFLKDDAKDFAQKYRVEQGIKKHSNFISFPIKVGEDQINTVTALWREPKSSVKKDQYKEFYTFLTYDSEEPLEIIHKSVDAPIQFNCLLFIPSKNMDMFGFNREDYGLDLYIRRVLIQHKNKELLPEYLSFVRGVVDSEDLPLNISRETLQENLVFTKIANTVTGQILTTLTQLAKDDKEKYTQFWNEHGKILKMGYADYANRDKYMDLLRFNSSNSLNAKEYTSLAEYVERKKEDQKEIYYMFGASREAVAMDPHVEIFKRKGIEILYLYEPADEFVMSSLGKYNDFNIVSVDQADLINIEKFEDVESSDKKVEELSKDDSLQMNSLLSKMKEYLGERITEVKISSRLKDSPACLVNTDNTMSASMQKIMGIVNKDNAIPKKIMEINQDHHLVRNMLKIFKNDTDDQFIKDATEQLYDSSLLLEGYLSDPHKLVSRINHLLAESSEWYTATKNIK
ncbi:MAG: molecular chaperone HtpG [Ignavibacteriae bacterium HGW-Ignavibacteriae-2]|jgi:molecular chaperone HtpG|nr:MAG: molecular chaperone HtpG [Ignavibacteriae bacterium HGW-Ignavibacteriae-2]